jgi:hypothetical protein
MNMGLCPYLIACHCSFATDTTAPCCTFQGECALRPKISYSASSVEEPKKYCSYCGHKLNDTKE